MPASVDKISVCEETGLLPRAGCPVITEYFDIGDIPTDYCDQHFYGDDESGMQEYTTEEEIYNPEPTPDPNNPETTRVITRVIIREIIPEITPVVIREIIPEITPEIPAVEMPVAEILVEEIPVAILAAEMPVIQKNSI